jgi:hypothetical protein
MKRRILPIALLLGVASIAPLRSDPQERPARLPNGRSQTEAILKEDHKKSLEDAAKLLDLAEGLKIELEKNDRHVLSVSSIRKTEEIEKLAKRIRSRLKRF